MHTLWHSNEWYWLFNTMLVDRRTQHAMQWLIRTAFPDTWYLNITCFRYNNTKTVQYLVNIGVDIALIDPYSFVGELDPLDSPSLHVTYNWFRSHLTSRSIGLFCGFPVVCYFKVIDSFILPFIVRCNWIEFI